jgi:hypothetical protein
MKQYISLILYKIVKFVKKFVKHLYSEMISVAKWVSKIISMLSIIIYEIISKKR